MQVGCKIGGYSEKGFEAYKKSSVRHCGKHRLEERINSAQRVGESMGDEGMTGYNATRTRLRQEWNSEEM